MLAMLASAFCRYLELAALLQAVGIGVDGTDRNEFRHKSPSSLNIGRVGATPRFSLDDLSSFGQPELMRLLVHALRQKAKITYRDVAVHLRNSLGSEFKRVCLSEIKHVHTDDGVRREMA